MRKLLPLLLCLLISIFTVARAMNPGHVFAPKAEATALISLGNAEEEVDSDDDESAENASNDGDENSNDDDGGEPFGDEDIVGDDNGADDDGGDENGSDDDGGDQSE